MMASALPFALLLLTTLSGGSALPNADGFPEEKEASGINSTAIYEKEPIALTKYIKARFLLGTSTNTRFVTTTTSTTITCVSKIDNAAAACKRRRKRSSLIKLENANNKASVDSSLMELEDEDARSGRLLFSAATVFTTLTFTQVVDNTVPAKISVSLSCAPAGSVSLCYG